jgi:hypothetical protein
MVPAAPGLLTLCWVCAAQTPQSLIAAAAAVPRPQWILVVYAMARGWRWMRKARAASTLCHRRVYAAGQVVWTAVACAKATIGAGGWQTRAALHGRSAILPLKMCSIMCCIVCTRSGPGPRASAGSSASKFVIFQRAQARMLALKGLW